MFRCEHPSAPILFLAKYSISSYLGQCIASLASVLCSGVSILQHRYCSSLNNFYFYISSQLLHFYFPSVSVLQSYFSHTFPTHRSSSPTILVLLSFLHILRMQLSDVSLGHPLWFFSSLRVAFRFYINCPRLQVLHNQVCGVLIFPLPLHISLRNLCFSPI